jgi:hypothetical protein
MGSVICVPLALEHCAGLFDRRTVFNQDSSDEYDVPLDTKRLLIAYWCAFFFNYWSDGRRSSCPKFHARHSRATGNRTFASVYVGRPDLCFETSITPGCRQLSPRKSCSVQSDTSQAIRSLASLFWQPRSTIILFNCDSVKSCSAPCSRWPFCRYPSCGQVKQDYRFWLATAEPNVTEQVSARVEWLLDRVTSGSIDYTDAAIKLANRIGYTRFYAVALAK